MRKIIAMIVNVIDSLTRPAVMEELVTLATKEPSTDIEERWRYKYPNVACELLTCDVPTLNEKLAGTGDILLFFIRMREYSLVFI